MRLALLLIAFAHVIDAGLSPLRPTQTYFTQRGNSTTVLAPQFAIENGQPLSEWAAATPDDCSAMCLAYQACSW